MNKHYHLVGIGGIGMSGIAQLLLSKGAKVSGSDLKESRITDELKKQGAQIFINHASVNIKGADLLVYSSAISEDNPEIKEAKRLNIPLIKRAQTLALLMQDKTVITVTGSHGKTTTTSLVSCMLLEAGLFPTVAIGGILKNINTNARFGNGKLFVAEADESDGSFLYYRPQYSIITNIDREHLDYYKSFENELEAFRQFLNKTKENGCVFCCADDSNLMEILKDCRVRSSLFGLKENAGFYPKNIKMEGLTCEFDCYFKGDFIDRFSLALGGEHNISNALSVIALGLELKIELGFIKSALANYKGARRRLDIKLQNDSCIIMDDYAHHPTEIKAALSAVENMKAKRIVVVFQPHRYSRTRLLWEDFAKSFDLADYLVITDIYPASEQSIPGITGEALCAKIQDDSSGKQVCFLEKEKITGHILKIMRPQDLVIILGAGDIVRVSDELAERLQKS